MWTRFRSIRTKNKKSSMCTTRFFSGIQHFLIWQVSDTAIYFSAFIMIAVLLVAKESKSWKCIHRVEGSFRLEIGSIQMLPAVVCYNRTALFQSNYFNFNKISWTRNRPICLQPRKISIFQYFLQLMFWTSLFSFYNTLILASLNKHVS